MHYCFAYGSNMDLEQMKKRCPGSVLLGKAVLKDYRIAFSIFSDLRKCGCADIQCVPGSEVWGLLYRISDSDLDALDEYEGHPVHYRRISCSVTDETGVVRNVETYEVVNKNAEHLPPSEEYLGIMVHAAEKFSFPGAYQSFLRGFSSGSPERLS